jgi:hypothetical protein
MQAIQIHEKRKIPKNVKMFATAAVVGVATLGTFWGIGIGKIKETVAESAPLIYTKFKDAETALKSFDTKQASASLAGAVGGLASIEAVAKTYRLEDGAVILGRALPTLKAIPEALRALSEFGAASLQVVQDLDLVKANVTEWLLEQEGASLIAALERIRASISAIGDLSKRLRGHAASFGYGAGIDVLSSTEKFETSERLLASLVKVLDTKEPRHIAVLFQNPSELRPGGGFLGSFADVTYTRDGIQEVRTWDIYDLDGQLAMKVVPPRELQGITERWGARDANWFFDFPTSARKVASFLEASKILSEVGITFEGVVAVNVEVLQSFLEATGPIKLPEYNLTITPSNFLSEIQEEVEAGKDNRAGEPKRILKVLTPLLLERLGTLTGEAKQGLLAALADHARRRDIMAYAKDWNLQGLLATADIGGSVAAIPENGTVDYLAVVHANIAGGKTDAVTEEHIRLSVKIDGEGRIDDYVTIERTHHGDRETENWYRTANKGYTKVFTPRGSTLLYAEGTDAVGAEPTVDYTKEKYLVDADLANVEATRRTATPFPVDILEESGKTVYGLWQKIARGETETLELEYVHPGRMNLGSESSYELVFQKQSGAKTSLDVVVAAPPGFHWKESGTPAFNFVTPDALGTVRLALTLVRDQEEVPSAPGFGSPLDR